MIEDLVKKEWFSPVPLFFDATCPLALAIMDRELTESQFTRDRMRDPDLPGFLCLFSYAADLPLDLKEMEEGAKAGALKRGGHLSPGIGVKPSRRGPAAHVRSGA